MKLWKLAAVVFGVLALAGTAVGVIAAQEGTATPAPEDTPDAVEDAGGRVDEYLSLLAGNLGVTVEELEAAMRQTQLDLLDQAVEEGRISEEEAAEVRERIESGEAPLFPRPGGHIRHHIGWDLIGEVAEFLGLEPRELLREKHDGQTLAEIAAAQGVGEDDLVAFLLAEITGYADQALENGRINQERHDEIIANAPARVDELIHSEGFPRRPGPRPPFEGEVAPGAETQGLF